MKNKMLSFFRKIAILEGISFISLAFTMLLKYKYSQPLPNYIVGMAHGFLFIIYMLLLLYLTFKEKWTKKELLFGVIASLVPFGTFVADKHLFKPKMY